MLINPTRANSVGELITRSQLRSMTVLALFAQMWMMYEPAWFVMRHGGSWALKLSTMSALGPTGITVVLSVAVVMTLPLWLALLWAPGMSIPRRSIPAAVVGLLIGSATLLHLALLATKLDAGQVVESYLSRGVLLGLHALVVACWANGELVAADLIKRHAGAGAGEVACSNSL